MPAGSQAPLRRWTPAATHPFLQKQMPAGSNAPPRCWTRTRLRWLRPRNRPRTCFQKESVPKWQQFRRAACRNAGRWSEGSKKARHETTGCGQSESEGHSGREALCGGIQTSVSSFWEKNWPQSTCCISMLVERRATEAVVGTNSEQTESSVQGWLCYLPFPSGLLQLMLAQERIPTLERDWAFGRSAGKKKGFPCVSLPCVEKYKSLFHLSFCAPYTCSIRNFFVSRTWGVLGPRAPVL